MVILHSFRLHMHTTLNLNKYWAITFSHSSPCSCNSYYLNNIPLSTRFYYNYLAVHITPDLSWSPHIQHIIVNTSKSLGYSRRMLKSAPSCTKLIAFQALDHHKIECAFFIWWRWQTYPTGHFESIQNRALRFIFSHYPFETSVSGLGAKASVLTLAQRCELSRLTLFHKILP